MQEVFLAKNIGAPRHDIFLGTPFNQYLFAVTPPHRSTWRDRCSSRGTCVQPLVKPRTLHRRGMASIAEPPMSSTYGRVRRLYSDGWGWGLLVRQLWHARAHSFVAGPSGHWVHKVPEGLLKCADATANHPLRARRRARKCTSWSDGQTWTVNHLTTERQVMKHMEGLGVVPTVFALSNEPSCLLASDAGSRLTRESTPANAGRQLAAIAEVLRRKNISHNDIKREEILVDPAGVLRLVDFGYATPTWAHHVHRWRSNCDAGKAPWHFADDETSLRSALEDARRGRPPVSRSFSAWHCPALDPAPSFGRRPPELHIALIWNASLLSRAAVLAHEWMSNSSSTLELMSTSVVLRSAAQLRKMCFDMYVDAAAVRWHGDCSPHGLSVGMLLVQDWLPRYGWGRSVSTRQNLNLHMHGLKGYLRGVLIPETLGARALFATSGVMQVHASVNREETLLTLRPLVIANLALRGRPSFEHFGALFRTLDRFAPLAYVVQRHHLPVAIIDTAGLNAGIRLFAEAEDVDILVNDYYLFKTVTGALSTSTVHMREQNNGGHIQSTVRIGGHEVAFDIRFVGDGYVDREWQMGILKRRKRHMYSRRDSSEGSFLVPGDEDYFFMYLYHSLVQKKNLGRHLTERARNYLAPLAAAIGVNPVPSTLEMSEKAPRLWRLLDDFRSDSGYKYSCPSDPGVLLTAPLTSVGPRLSQCALSPDPVAFSRRRHSHCLGTFGSVSSAFGN